MANHVNSYCVVKANQAGMQKFDSIMERIKRDPDQYEKSLGFAFFDSVEEFTLDVMIDSIGAKWAYATDITEDSLAVYSAWSYPEVFYEYLAQEIGQVDPHVHLQVTFEDEMPNFIGVSVFDSRGIYDCVELDGDEFHQHIRSIDAEIAAEYDEENEEYSELGWEYVSESQWEYASDWQHKVLQTMMIGMLGDDYFDKL